MHIKQTKLRCGVKNCRNKDAYMLSKSKEMGASVIICGDCIKEAYEQLFRGDKKEEKSVTEAPKSETKTAKSVTEMPKSEIKTAKGGTRVRRVSDD